ncbi:MAG: universal stress protein [Haloplanus sp.]
MYETILIPTDGSPGVENAVTHGLVLAETTDGTVHSLYVIDTRVEPPGLDPEERAELRAEARERGQTATDAVGERAAEYGLDVRRDVREGTPHQEILSHAREHGVDLVVMGTEGTSAATRLGSTTERVVALADVPVLAVPRAATIERPETGHSVYDQVVIPTDGSDDAERAADHGLELAEHYGAEVHVVYVVDTTVYDLQDSPRSIVGLLESGGQKAVESIAADAEERNLPVTTGVMRGRPAEAIREYATGVNADLVVAGTRGRAADTDHLLGSTTARLLRRADRPVLVVE